MRGGQDVSGALYCSVPSPSLMSVLVMVGLFLLLRNFSVTISVSPHVCFILV